MQKRIAIINNVDISMPRKTCLYLNVNATYEGIPNAEACGEQIDCFSFSKGEREGTAYGCELIRQLMLFFGVNNLSEVKDYVCYVYYETRNDKVIPLGLSNLDISDRVGNKKEVIYSRIKNKYKSESARSETQQNIEPVPYSR